MGLLPSCLSDRARALAALLVVMVVLYISTFSGIDNLNTSFIKCSLQQELKSYQQQQQNRSDNLVDKALKKVGQEAREKLIAGMNVPCNDKGCTFDDVLISLPFTAPILGDRGSFNLANDAIKNVLHPRFYSGDDGSNNTCLVYGIGVHQDSRFETMMAQHCTVHAFDCTTALSSPSVVNQTFTFHQICIGDSKNLDEGNLPNEITNPNPGQPLRFKPLTQVMTDLGHSKLDMLKFDIEGGEWALLEYILKHPQVAPQQILFEVHTQGANPHWVPSKTVSGKTKRQVNQMFLRLHDMGYRVLNKAINPGDAYCCDFTLILVETPGSGERRES